MLAVAVVIIDFGIDVEPVLNSFRPIFLDVGGGIDVFPEATGDGVVEGSLQFVVKLRVYRRDAHIMNRMGKFVNHNILCMILIDLVGQDVFLGAGREGHFERAAKASRAEVPVDRRVIDEKSVLGDIGGAFITRHNADAGVAARERLHHVGGKGFRQGIEAYVGGIEAAVRDAPGADDVDTVHVHVFLIKRVEVQLGGGRGDRWRID